MSKNMRRFSIGGMKIDSRDVVLCLLILAGCGEDGQETPSPTPDETPVEMPSECPDEMTVPMAEVWTAWGM